MASDTLVRAYHRRKTKPELETALDVLLDGLAEPDDVIEQRLAEVEFSFRIKSTRDRERLISIIEGAIRLHDGEAVGAGRGHFFNFGSRPLE